MKMAQERRNS